MTSPLRVSSSALLRSLLAAAGVGLGVVSGASCSGTVVVDGADAGTGTGGSQGNCNPATLTFEKTNVCVAATSGVCPVYDSPTLASDLLEELGDPGCCEGELAAVLCGPTSTADGQCCYDVDGYMCDWCEGRPFVVDGAARVAAISVRGGWLGPAGAEVEGLDPAARAALAQAWSRSALDEHAAIASFARFALELLAVGAPAELVVAAQRALGEEIRHAELCFALASGYAGQPVGPGPLAVGGATAGPSGLAEIAAATAREGCIGEALAAFEAAAAREEATDPAVRAALDEIARDEAEHAALAFRFVAWALDQGDASVREAVSRELTARRAPKVAGATPDADPAVMRAHGKLPSAERQALAARCLAEVIGPAARALLGKERATGGVAALA